MSRVLPRLWLTLPLIGLAMILVGGADGWTLIASSAIFVGLSEYGAARRRTAARHRAQPRVPWMTMTTAKAIDVAPGDTLSVSFDPPEMRKEND